ncbi:DUF262 domain-containing protein [Chryseobacterium mucoviscidosis]|uniref:DUF262 domain-containing protein n=1 Tax=Chryseobacterium mucoviscidosis TaxID=1945581 RepID=UPI0031DD419A
MSQIIKSKIQKKKTYLSLEDIFKLNLIIPEYQRPYKWKSKNVHQLIDDIIYVVEKQDEYSLGTVVLFSDDKERDLNNKFEIVDGQQRLTTLTIILYTLKSKINLPLINSNYEHEISRYNILETKKIISSRKSEFTENIINFLINKCYFNVFILNKKKEAFQFFDTQNSRGLDLKPHDLLKAFHLRSMSSNGYQTAQTEAVEQWENYNKDELHNFIHYHLYRIRKWSKMNSGLDYSKETIDIFKGIDLNGNSKTSKVKKVQMLESALKHDNDFGNIYPMEYNQVIPNGKRFFEMVSFYKNNDLYYKLKAYNTHTEDNSFFINLGYSKENLQILTVVNSLNWRKGDLAIRNMFFNALCLFNDRFGDEKANIVFNKLFIYCYKKRFESKRLGYPDIDRFALKCIFRLIEDALSVKEIINFRIDYSDAVQKIADKKYVNDLDELIEEFEKLI